MPLDIAGLREEFPALELVVDGKQSVYLDSAATSHKPLSVIQAEIEFYTRRNAAVHRGAHTLAAEATELFEQARQTVAHFIGAGVDELVWTSGATAAINLLAYSFSNASLGRGGATAERFRLGPGDEIVVTELEHHANLIPWQELAARTGAILRFIRLEDDGSLRISEAAEVIGSRTRILAFSHVSNVLGSRTPVSQLVSLAHSVGALVVLDACQSIPHERIDVTALDVDFLAFSGHKMLGPLGIGALYGRRELLKAMPPFLTGGSMITTVTMESAEFLPPPARFEAGTQPVAQAIALAAAIDFLEKIGMEAVHKRDSELGQSLAVGISDIPGVRLLGPAHGQPRVGLASFVVDGVHPHDVGQYLNERAIAVRVGHHCAGPLHRRLGISASTRASSYLYTTDSEIDVFLEALSEVRRFFRV